MQMNKFRWEFGTCGFIEVYKDNVACAHFTYNDKLKVRASWTTGYLSKHEWDEILACVKEAKALLKKLKRI